MMKKRTICVVMLALFSILFMKSQNVFAQESEASLEETLSWLKKRLNDFTVPVGRRDDGQLTKLETSSVSFEECRSSVWYEKSSLGSEGYWKDDFRFGTTVVLAELDSLKVSVEERQIDED